MDNLHDVSFKCSYLRHSFTNAFNLFCATKKNQLEKTTEPHDLTDLYPHENVGGKNILSLTTVYLKLNGFFFGLLYCTYLFCKISCPVSSFEKPKGKIVNFLVS